MCPTNPAAQRLKPQQQQQPPLDNTAASSTCSQPPSLSAVVLDNPDLVGLVASFLRFGMRASVETQEDAVMFSDSCSFTYSGITSDDLSLDNSLLRFALCCRRAQSLVMRDGPWWKLQLLYFNMQRPLIPLNKWSCLSPNSDMLAVEGDGFVALDSGRSFVVCWATRCMSEVAPKLREVRHVIRGKRQPDRTEEAMEAVGLVSGRHDYAVDVYDDPGCNVYPQSTPAFFNELAEYLSEPYRHYMLSNLIYNKRFYRQRDTSAAHNEAYCQWLLGCWDAVLLPKCAQWIVHASININMECGLPQPFQKACLIHALSCMSGVTQLSLQWDSAQWVTRKSLQYHPALLSLSELIAILPKLASLHIDSMPLFGEMIESLMTSCQLQRLWLDNTPVYGLAYSECCCMET